MDCKARTIWNFPPFNWIDPQNKRSLIEFWGKLSSCFQVSVNTHYFNYMMISMERVCKQPTRRQRLHTREAPCFYFPFSRTSYISQKHVSNGRGSASAMQPVKIFQRKFPPGLPFSQLSPCPGCDFCLRSPKHSSRAGQVFMINPKFLFKYLKMAWKHWLRCSGLRNLQCKEVKKQLPLAVYPAPLQSTPSLELLVKVCWN